MRIPADSGGQALTRAGEWGLAGLLVLSLVAAVLVALHASPLYELLIPALLLGVSGVYVALRHEVLGVVVMMALSVLVLIPQDGIGIGDLVFAGYYGLFVLLWFVPRLPRYAEYLRRPEDVALLMFLSLAVGSLFLTVLFRGSLSDAIVQLFALSVFCLYFPIRDVCLRHERGVLYTAGALLFVITFAAIRNLVRYQEIVLAAQQAWQFTTARVWINDSLMMAGAVIAMVFTLFARERKHSVGFALIFAASFVALVMTQSRGFWVAFLVGASFVFVLVGRRQKIRMLIAGAGVAGISAVVAIVFLSEFLPLIIAGLTDRFGSLGTATTEDVSLVNRFVESWAVLERIALNPVVGYGMGVPFSFYDITWDATMTGTFIHSGYLSLWYRFGVFGLLLMLFFWGRAIWAGFSAFKDTSARLSLRTPALATAAVLFAYILPAQTSNPFVLLDSIFLFTALSAIAVGARDRMLIERDHVHLQKVDAADHL
jgi:O-antigen ligase